ncbi:MAG: hypothetical protein AAB734_02375 [Patescibacteria group bacterium]
MKTTSIMYTPKQRAEVPSAWRKAAGILRTSAKRNIAELKKMRSEWNKRG